MAATGITPQSFDQFLAAHPATVQDRWFARLYLIKPIAILALALIWIAHGAFGLAAIGGSGLRVIFQQGAVSLIFLAEPLLAFALGLGVLVRSTARPALIGMIVLSVLLSSPFAGGPWVQVLDTLVAVAVNILPPALALAILDDR